MAILDFVNFNGERLDLQDSALTAYVRDMSPVATVGPADMVSVDDAAPLTAEELAVAMEPVQNLHGYDNPWPEGGSKNRCLPLTPTTSARGLALLLNEDGSYRLVGQYTGQTTYVFGASEYFVLPAGSYVLSGGGNVHYTLQLVSADHSSEIIAESGAGSGVVPFTLSGNRQVFARVFVNLTSSSSELIDLTLRPMIRLASETDGTFVPYSNICPISGWDGATVTDEGKNLLDFSAFGTYSNWSSTIVTYGNFPTSSGNKGFLLEGIKAGETYTLSLGISATSFPATYVYLCSANGTSSNRIVALTTGSYNTDRCTFTAEEGHIYYIRSGNMSNDSAFNSSVMQYISFVQIELGSTATAYEPHKSRTASVDFGQTVYGGTVDLVTGECVITKKLYNASDIQGWRFAASSSTETRKIWRTADTAFSAEISKAVLWGMCSKYAPAFDKAVGEMPDFAFRTLNTGVLYVCDSRYPSSDYETAFKESLSDVQFVFNLAEPITLPPLTPAELELFKGVNSVSADAGQVTVTYRQDVFLTLNKRINELQALVLES